MARKKRKTAKLQSGQPESKDRDPIKEDKLQLLERDKRRVSRAREIRKTWETKFRVEEAENFAIGIQHGNGDRGLVLNHFWATLKAELPNLFYSRPKFFVRPKPGRDNPVEESQTRVAEGILETIADQDHNLKRAGKFAVMQNFFRIGVLKCVYDPKMVPNPQAGKPKFKTDEAGNPIIINGEGGQPALDENGATLAEVETDPATGEGLIEPKKILTDEAYRWEWVHGKNMLLPDEGPDQSRWTWVGEEILVHLDEAKDDENLGSKDIRDQFVASETTQGAPKDSSGANPEDEWFRYFQIWDFKLKRLRIHAEGQDFGEFIVDKDLPDGIEDHPYAIMQGWTPILAPEPSPWPYPHTNSWLDPQREYNHIRSLQINGAKRSARKLGYDDNTFPDEDEAFKALQSDKDMEGVRLNNAEKPPIPFVAPDINAGIDRAVPLLLNDWELITGLPGSRRSSPNAETLGQEEIAVRQSNLRDVDLQDGINDWLTTAGHKMLQLVKATLTIGLWIKLRGFSDKEFQEYAANVLKVPPEAFQALPALKQSIMERYGKEKWQRVTREELEFQADVGVVPGSARPRTLEAERQDALGLLKLLGPDILSAAPEFLGWIMDMFENVPERVKESLKTGGDKLVEIRANQAGRTQGGQGGQAQSGAGGGNGAAQSALALRMIQGGGG